MSDPTPYPRRDGRRLTPTRAGVINLWDYRDEEFVFVDGWLVLRGPNGSGKTKALEVLFPFVLDGRIEPRRLNPFASEDRTMKSNLLYRGQDVAHAYVWMEFGDGSRHVTVGIGLRAHRHVDRVTRWHFVTDGRVGVDFSLIDADDRPLSRKELIAELGAEAIRDSTEEYRHLLDERLFGLGPARYEQLLDLVLTLRKPQLAKDLNPTELSRTLQRGLRPLDEHLLVEAASSFDDMEAVARTLEGLVAADEATASFLAVYSTYLRTHARAAADTLTARRTAVDEHRAGLAEAQAALAGAAAAEQAAGDRLRAVDGEPARLRARLDSLRSSAAYQSHEQLTDLERHVSDLAAAVDQATATVAAEERTADLRAGEWERARTATVQADAEVRRLAAALATDAEQAGIGWTADDTAVDGLAERLRARVAARRDDLRAVRTQLDRHVQADRDRSRAENELAAARDDLDAAQQDNEAAETAVTTARAGLHDDLRRWADQHRATLEQADLTALPEALAGAVERIGEADTPTLREVYAEATGGRVADLRDRVAALRARRDTLTGQRDEVSAERDRIAAEHDDAPPAPATRRAGRDGRAGAPLWRLVRFADHVPPADAAGIESALHAAGLLDAWVHPDPASAAAALAAGDADDQLLPLPPGRRPTGRTLADVLVCEDQAAVPTGRVDEVLATIALSDVDDGAGAAAPTTIDTTGRYRHGIGAGAAYKDAPEYIGATARAARRAARIAECERRIAALDSDLAAVDRTRTAVDDQLTQLATAAAQLPPATSVTTALRDLDRAATMLRARRETATTAAGKLDQAVAGLSAAAAGLRRVAAERQLPPDQLDQVTEAVDRFGHSGAGLRHARSSAAAAATAEQAAEQRHTEATDRLAAAQTAAHLAEVRHREKEQAYRTLYDTIGAEASRVLAEAAEVTEQLATAEATVQQVRDELNLAGQRRAAAGKSVELGERTLTAALDEAYRDALRLRPYAQPDLLGLLRCPTDLRWPASHTPAGPAPASAASPGAGSSGPAGSPDAAERELDEQIVALHVAILAATRELSPSETSLKQSATRLTTALTDLQAQLPAAGLDHRPEWDTDDGVIVVRVADEQGLTPVSHFAQRIAAQRRDQEQLLTDAEQRILEDALLGQLARQIHHRTIEARDLVDGMDSQMRARRMSSGLTVGVGWRLADTLDAEQREACKLLERDPARLGPAQLTTLRRHFASRIKTARAVGPERPYRDLLAEVLDYRQWRVFAFTLHRPGGGTEALTRARHSQLSGGEQSVSLHLPLFAAANALFDSARPDAPRLLGLDEAFAGVDDNGRGELMSLATQFGLDLFMTGYDLWATHPAVSGAAHYDLSHSAVEHAVSTVLVVWDGANNVADFDGSLARALGSPETRRRPDPTSTDPAWTDPASTGSPAGAGSAGPPAVRRPGDDQPVTGSLVDG